MHLYSGLGPSSKKRIPSWIILLGIAFYAIAVNSSFAFGQAQDSLTGSSKGPPQSNFANGNPAVLESNARV